MTFEDDVLRQVIAVAVLHKIEPEALLAVVETESAGKSLEVDGKTPCLLFERHIFYRELKKSGQMTKASMAVNAGMANTSWQPKTQYKDQRTSAQRLALYAKAKAIDPECAARSCSWGVGQTMGFLAEEMKFKNGEAMLDYMTKGGVPAQVECMVREVENKHLTPKLNAHNWAGFARVYNGPGYAQNSYDDKMASAYLKWKRTDISKIVNAPVAKPVEVPPEIKPAPMPKVEPHPPVATAGAGVGIAATIAAIWAYVQTAEFRYIAIFVLIFVLSIITAAVIYRRRQEAEALQLGTLASVNAL
jgi:hypothetical protein